MFWLTGKKIPSNKRQLRFENSALIGRLGSVPVLDGVVCATKQAEVLVELGKKTSKLKTYRPPEKKRFDGMFAHFSTDGSADKKQAAAE